MAHPKSRISKQRKRKRRTHYKIGTPTLGVCKNTGETHIMHRAYMHEGNMFYRGKMLVQSATEVAETED